ncbi:MAG: MalY/PatB family protein [Lachnospiraceae bacterium]
MIYNFDEMINRRGTFAAKIDALPAGSPEDALSVWVADMDFACAQPILDALHLRIEKKIFGYTLYNNVPLKDAVTGWFQRRYDWDIPKEDIFFSPGVVPALALLLDALTKEGDGIIIQRPVYYPFTNRIKGGNRVIYNNPLLYEDGGYKIDFDDLDKKFSDSNAKGLIFCSPHNPVGRVWTPEELQQVVEIAKKYNKWIISDEIHMDLTRNGVVHTPLLKVSPEYADNIVVCTAPSKTFNIAGMQLSNIIIHNKEWQKKWLAVSEDKYSLGLANPFGIAATIAAYNEGEEWLEQLKNYLDDNIRYIMTFLEENLPKARMIECQGTYLVWIDLNKYEKDPKKLEHLMQNTARIAFDEGYIFGEEGNGFERINIAMPLSRVKECMERMKKALDNYNM